MLQNWPNKILLAAALVTSTGLVVAIVIRYHESNYGGRALDEWFDSHTDGKAKAVAFRAMGKNSFPFLVAKLGGSTADRERACLVIETAFQRDQIENSKIKDKLINLLKSENKGEELYAYTAIRQLGLDVPASIIATAARTCPSIRASEEEAVRAPKLARLQGMTTTNSPDCSYVALLCNDPDSQVQMAAFSVLIRWESVKANNPVCDDKVQPALASLLENSADASVLRMALSYIRQRPSLMNKNLATVCSFLQKTEEPGLQSECLALIASLARHESLPLSVRRSVESFHSRIGLKANIRRETTALLEDNQLWTGADGN